MNNQMDNFDTNGRNDQQGPNGPGGPGGPNKKADRVRRSQAYGWW